MDGNCSRCHRKPVRYHNTLDMGGSITFVADTDGNSCHVEDLHTYTECNLCEDCQQKLQEFMGCVV